MSQERRLVEVGRVCLVNYGPNLGKTVVIINTIDSRRVLVDGATSGVPRQMMPLKRLSITSVKCDIAPGARLNTLMKAYKAADVDGKWKATTWAQGIQKKSVKANMTDFDRFKLMVARKTRSRAVNKALKTMKKK